MRGVEEPDLAGRVVTPGRRSFASLIAHRSSLIALPIAALGIPAFNSLQDYRDYDTREHHTNMDFVERVSIDDLKQNAVVLAWFAIQAAQREEKIPR